MIEEASQKEKRKIKQRDKIRKNERKKFIRVNARKKEAQTRKSSLLNVTHQREIEFNGNVKELMTF